MEHEASLTTKVLTSLSANAKVKVLGSLTAPRLAIVSFMVEHPETGLYLHHNFVSAILNDLFGIQARGTSVDKGMPCYIYIYVCSMSI